MMTNLKKHIKHLPVVFSLIIVVLYIFIYQQAPFSTFANDLLTNLLTFVAAAFAAGSVFLVWSSYARHDLPYIIWRSFAFGFIAWALAELVWAITSIIALEVPVPGPSDALWYIGFAFFTYGFVHQYRVTYQTRARAEWIGAGLVWVLVATLSYIAAALGQNGGFSLAAWTDIAYPFADVAMLVFALGLAWAFRGGAFAHPWLSMGVFALSDGLYAWLIQSGAYAWSVETGNPLTLFVDVLYLLAYLIVGLGFLSQYNLLKDVPKIQIQLDDID